MDLLKCDKCRNRNIMCCVCEKNKQYRETDFSHDVYIRNKAIDDFIKSEDYLMEKIKEEKAEVSIDYEWRKVVCLDDIRRMLHQGLLEIAEQLKAGGENEQGI